MIEAVFEDGMCINRPRNRPRYVHKPKKTEQTRFVQENKKVHLVTSTYQNRPKQTKFDEIRDGLDLSCRCKYCTHHLAKQVLPPGFANPFVSNPKNGLNQ